VKTIPHHAAVGAVTAATGEEMAAQLWALVRALQPLRAV
jgi:hypothetical protein